MPRARVVGCCLTLLIEGRDAWTAVLAVVPVACPTRILDTGFSFWVLGLGFGRVLGLSGRGSRSAFVTGHVDLVIGAGSWPVIRLGFGAVDLG